jgi:hypothetical protein
MTIELSEKTIGVWYMQVTQDSDFLGAATEVDDGFEITYRFRYYKDDKTFGSDDRKNWYEWKTSESKEKVIEIMRGVITRMRQKDGNIPVSDCHELLMNEDGIEEFMEVFTSMPFADSMVLSANEAKWMGLDGNARPE